MPIRIEEQQSAERYNPHSARVDIPAEMRTESGNVVSRVSFETFEGRNGYADTHYVTITPVEGETSSLQRIGGLLQQAGMQFEVKRNPRSWVEEIHIKGDSDPARFAKVMEALSKDVVMPGGTIAKAVVSPEAAAEIKAHPYQQMHGANLNGESRVAAAAERTATIAAEGARVGEVAKLAENVAGHVAEAGGKTGLVGKVVAVGAGLSAAVAAGSASAAEFDATPASQRSGSKFTNVIKAAGSAAWETIGGIVGAPDMVRGDNVRGASALAGFAFIPGTDFVDAAREQKAANSMAKETIAATSAVIPAGKRHTGDELLDRIAELKAMQERGVKKVTVKMMGAGITPLGRFDQSGAIVNEGQAMPDFSDTAGMDQRTMSPAEAIEMNTRLYLARGGSAQKAQKAVQQENAKQQAQGVDGQKMAYAEAPRGEDKTPRTTAPGQPLDPNRSAAARG